MHLRLRLLSRLCQPLRVLLVRHRPRVQRRGLHQSRVHLFPQIGLLLLRGLQLRPKTGEAGLSLGDAVLRRPSSQLRRAHIDGVQTGNELHRASVAELDVQGLHAVGEHPVPGLRSFEGFVHQSALRLGIGRRQLFRQGDALLRQLLLAGSPQLREVLHEGRSLGKSQVRHATRRQLRHRLRGQPVEVRQCLLFEVLGASLLKEVEGGLYGRSPSFVDGGHGRQSELGQGRAVEGDASQLLRSHRRGLDELPEALELSLELRSKNSRGQVVEFLQLRLLRARPDHGEERPLPKEVLQSGSHAALPVDFFRESSLQILPGGDLLSRVALELQGEVPQDPDQLRGLPHVGAVGDALRHRRQRREVAQGRLVQRARGVEDEDGRERQGDADEPRVLLRLGLHGGRALRVQDDEALVVLRRQGHRVDPHAPRAGVDGVARVEALLGRRIQNAAIQQEGLAGAIPSGDDDDRKGAVFAQTLQEAAPFVADAVHPFRLFNEGYGLRRRFHHLSEFGADGAAERTKRLVEV